jgi:hypothetical protein
MEVAMSSLTLKDVPEPLLVRLRAVAARERRSLNQQAIIMLEASLSEMTSAEQRAYDRVQAWRALAGGWTSDRPFEAEVDELMSVRSPGRPVDL